MGFKLLKNIVLLLIVNFQPNNCFSYHDYEKYYQPIEHLDTKMEHGIVLHFPKYSIKVFAERKELVPNANPNRGYYETFVPYSSDTIYNVQPNQHSPPKYQPNQHYPPTYQPNQPYPPIYQPTKHNPTIQYYPVANEFPLIHREPIETKPPCQITSTDEPHSEVPYDPILGLPKSSHKHSQTWFYGSPNWESNNQNILRSETPTFLQENGDQYTEPSSKIAEIENGPIISTAEIENGPIIATAQPKMYTDPRFIQSSSKFVKIHKPFGSKLFISKQKIIGHHDGFGHGSANHFGGHGHGGHFHSFDHSGHDFDHHHFGGGVTNVNKNTNIHVHSRNAEEDTEINDDNKREAKDPAFERIVGSHLFAAPRWRRDALSRKKRGVIDAVKVVTDHKARINVPKTAENVGAATRNLFEEDYSPVYHLRNALASAHDVIYTMLKVRPNGLLIPCRYKIVDGNEVSPIVGAINPELLRNHGTKTSGGKDYSPDQTIFSDDDPMHRMGEILRESVKWAHKSAEHASDAMHSARKAIVTARKHWPKLFVPYVTAVEIIKPRIGQEEEDIVGSAKDPEFVGVGKMMDYLGMTDKKPDYSPRVGSTHFGILHQKTDEEMILQKAKESLGSSTYHQFMSQLKKELGSTPSTIKETVGASRLTPENIKVKLALAKAKLKLRLPAKPIIPKLPIIPKKPLLLPKNPILRLEPPKTTKTPLASLIKPPALTLNPIIKSKKVGASNPIHIPHPKELEDSIEELKYKINEHLNIGSKARTNQIENDKNIEKHLQKLKDTLYEKYNIKTDNMEHSDILGLAIEEAQKNNPNILIEDVGAALSQENEEHVASIPNPVYTKEMQTPFMGLATKEEIDKYFQQIYDSSNDKKDK